VDDALPVSRRQALEDLERDFDRLRRLETDGSQLVTERLSLEQLGDEEMRAVVRSDVEEADDVRVTQGRGCACLALEARDELGGTPGEHLDGNAAVEARVAGAVDLTHSAGAQ
jgi:hypothetical protein